MKGGDEYVITSDDVTVHTLRHTAITRMLAAGIDDYTVMETVGHPTRAMLQRNNHPATEPKRTRSKPSIG